MFYRICQICGIKAGRVGGQKRTFMTKFPLDEDRCRRWVQVIGNEDLAYVPIEKLHELKFVCGKHFKLRDFKKKMTRLKRNAVPSVLLTAKPLSDEILMGFPLHILEPSKRTAVSATVGMGTRNSIKNIPCRSNFKQASNNNKQGNINLTELDDTFDNADSPSSPVIPEIGETTENEDTEQKNIFSWQRTELIETDDLEDRKPAPVPEIPTIPEDQAVTLSLFCDTEQEEVPSEPVVDPENVKYRCKDCAGIVDRFSWWCVQCCGGALCCVCAQRAPHDKHYVLRAPPAAQHKQTEAVLTVIRQQLQKENLLPFYGTDVSVKKEVKDEFECPPSPPDPAATPDPLAMEPPYTLHVEPHPDLLTEGPQPSTNDECADPGAVDHYPFKRPRLSENNQKCVDTNSTVTEDVQQHSFKYSFNNPKGSRPKVIMPRCSTGSQSGVTLIPCRTRSQSGVKLISSDMGSQSGIKLISSSDSRSQSGVKLISSHTGPQFGIKVTSSGIESQSGIKVTSSGIESQSGVKLIPSCTGPQYGIKVISCDTGSQSGIKLIPSRTGPQSGIKVISCDTGSQSGITLIPSRTGPQSGIKVVSCNTGSQSGITLIPSRTGPQSGMKVITSNTRSQSGIKVISCNTGSQSGVKLIPSRTGPQSGIKVISSDTGSQSGIMLISSATGSQSGQLLPSNMGPKLMRRKILQKINVGDPGGLKTIQKIKPSEFRSSDKGNLKGVQNVPEGIQPMNPKVPKLVQVLEKVDKSSTHLNETSEFRSKETVFNSDVAEGKVAEFSDEVLSEYGEKKQLAKDKYDNATDGDSVKMVDSGADDLRYDVTDRGLKDKDDSVSNKTIEADLDKE